MWPFGRSKIGRKTRRFLDGLQDRSGKTGTQALWGSVFAGHLRSAPPLLQAAAAGDTDTLRRLLDDGADTNPLLGNTLDVLGLAAMSGAADAVRLLLERGVRPQKFDDEMCPLALAAKHGHFEIVELLLSRSGITLEQVKQVLRDLDSKSSPPWNRQFDPRIIARLRATSGAVPMPGDPG